MRKALLAGLFLALLAAVPFIFPGYRTTLATEMLIFATLAMSIDILTGYAGRTPLCHGAIFGVALAVDDLALVTWGGDTFTVPVPQWLQGPLHVGNFFYPRYRLFVLGVGILVFIALWLLIHKTRLGALIRAGVDDAEMVEAMGVDIKRVFVGTFMIGCALAGIGGALGGAFLSLYPTADSEILVFSLAVVIIGGRGSLVGAAVGSLFVALLANFGQVWFPELAYFVIFGPMAALLAFRPLGLLGRAA